MLIFWYDYWLESYQCKFQQIHCTHFLFLLLSEILVAVIFCLGVLLVIGTVIYLIFFPNDVNEKNIHEKSPYYATKI